MSDIINSTMTTEEAFSFLRDVLCMTSPEERLKANRMTFLDEIVKAMQHRIPFHTVRSISTPQEKRHLPTFSEIKRDMRSKIGGMCYTLNVFNWILLRALGFETQFVPSDCRGYKDVHIVLVVRNLTRNGSTHMVDVGAACPSFRAISFDFGQEVSPVYQDSFLRYRFVRQDDIIIRQHRVDTDSERAKEFQDCMDGDWFSYLSIHYNKYVDVSYFNHSTTQFYTVVSPDVPFLTSLRCFAYPSGRFVCIKDTTLLVEDEEGHVHKSYFRSRDEIIAAFTLHFPQLDTEEIVVAMNDENVTLDFSKGKE